MFSLGHSTYPYATRINLQSLSSEQVYWRDPSDTHFIITSIRDHAVIQRPTYYGKAPASTATFGDFPDVFSAAGLIAAELGYARDHFEHTIFTIDRNLHEDLYAGIRPLEFTEVGAQLLQRLVMLSQRVPEIQHVLTATRNKRLREFGGELSKLPRFTTSHELPR